MFAGMRRNAAAWLRYDPFSNPLSIFFAPARIGSHEIAVAHSHCVDVFPARHAGRVGVRASS